ncbi:MAG: trigger factor [Gammaproteobacteria bacterium]|nr:trigger factor [Gammaproteobacteria bacterium]MBU6509074.1 trigger factor [Gammaproteobacteria bacterium]MDE1983367.1 trigger factor [Gammaproteobacteria bacterium]MDE2108199.1 trigger factor [Gammaproteobacteria bacterium]
MQVSIETTAGLERRMKVQVPAERVEREVEQRLRNLGKRAKLNGFRPGKIPFDVVKKRFGGEVRQEVLSDLLRDTCSEALAQEKVNPAGGPRIDTVNNEPGKDLEYTATFEVYPEIQLQGLEGIAVEKPQAEITAADVDAMLDNLRHQRARWETVMRPARKGDRLQLDFEGRVDGASFPGGKGEKLLVVLGENRMLKDFESGLDGVRADEARDFEVRFPDDYASKEVAGKTASFHTQVHRIEQQVLPELNEEFCRSFGVTEGGLEKLRAEVLANMQQELADTVRGRMKQQVLDALLAANPVNLPKALLDEEIEHLRQDALTRMGIKGTKKSVDLPDELFREQATRRVTLGLIIGELITRRQLQVDAKRVEQRLQRLAEDYSNPGEALRSLRSNSAVMREIEGLVLEDQVVDGLLEKAAVSDKSVSFRELMNFHEHDHEHHEQEHQHGHA